MCKVQYNLISNPVHSAYLNTKLFKRDAPAYSNTEFDIPQFFFVQHKMFTISKPKHRISIQFSGRVVCSVGSAQKVGSV